MGTTINTTRSTSTRPRIGTSTATGSYSSFGSPVANKRKVTPNQFKMPQMPQFPKFGYPSGGGLSQQPVYTQPQNNFIQDESLLNTPGYQAYIQAGNDGSPNWGGVGAYKDSLIQPQPTQPIMPSPGQKIGIPPEAMQRQQTPRPFNPYDRGDSDVGNPIKPKIGLPRFPKDGLYRPQPDYTFMGPQQAMPRYDDYKNYMR